ncbi:MAG: zinc-ribbon domain-containing protein [Anaerolineae bacterium]
MYCNQCGAKVEDDALICPNCGHHLMTAMEASEAQEPILEEVEITEPEPRLGGCGWAMIAGMLAGCAILLILGLTLLGVYQGIQERTRLNRAAASEHYHKGLEYFIAENYELAREEFALTLQLDPKHSDAATKLAEVEAFLSKRPTPTSALRYQTAILLYNEARELYNKGNWEGVITKLEQVQALDPEYEAEQVSMLLVEAYYKVGLKLVEENRLEEAIRYFDRALQFRPTEQAIREQKNLASLYLAGLGYWGANWQEAIGVFYALYQLQPDYKDTRQRLYDAYVSYANVLSTKGEWCAARDQYDRALAMSFSEELKAKREAAAQSCAVASSPTSTPPPSGTFVGKVVKIEDVGLQTAMMIRGQVLNVEGKPIVGIKVGLSAWDWSAPPAATNEEGIFAFDGLDNPVTYTVTLVDLPTVPLPVKADWSKLVWVEFRPQP